MHLGFIRSKLIPKRLVFDWPRGKIFAASWKQRCASRHDEDNSGRVLIFATDKTSMDRAIQEVEACTAEIEVGKTYRGIVRGVKEFGAFVECLPGKEGLVHISELADFRVNKTEDICKLGDEMIVKCLGIEKGKVRLSRKAALESSKPQNAEADAEPAVAE